MRRRSRLFRRMYRRLILSALLLTVAGLALGVWGPTPAVDGHIFDQHRNSIWLGHRWFDGRARPSDVAMLLPRLQQGGIEDLYVHVGPLDARGHIPEWSPTTWRPILEALHPRHVYAWLGGVTTDVFGIAPDTVALDSPTVRQAIVETAKDLVVRGGFDGIHYDLELIPNRQPGFLTLLDSTRAALPNTLLSVATPILHPPWTPLLHAWSSDYLGEVGARCDQVAVMTYDTSMQTATLYKRLLAWEVPALCEAVRGRGCHLILGVPSYRDHTVIHNPKAETLPAALDGIAWGLSLTPDRSAFQGIGLYAEWTTRPEDWTALEMRW
ncbi:MAG TPA: hypothetical protein VGO93_24970 [Candidatus Xenobia bacterium]